MRTQKEEREYHSLVKKIFRDEFNKLLEANDEDKERLVSLFHYTERELKKRTLAAMKFSIETMDKFQQYDYSEVFARTATYCAKPLLPYDYIHQAEGTEQGFAIWVLDLLKEEGRLDELYSCLPTEYAYSGKIIIDTNYSESLLSKIFYICENKESETKELFQKLLSMLPNEKILESEKYFDEKLWSLMGTFLEVSEGIMTELHSTVKELQDVQRGIIPLAALPFTELPIDKSEVERLLNRIQSFYALDEASYMSAADWGAIKTEEIQKIFKHLTNEKMKKFHIEDPYSICAMYHIHQFRQDNRFWIMGPTLSLLQMASLRLPWNSCLELCDNINVGQKEDLYRLQFNSDSFESCTDNNRLLSISQIVYHLTGGVVMPRKTRSYSAIRLILESQGVEERIINNILCYAQALSGLSGFEDDSFYDFEIGEENETLTDISNDVDRRTVLETEDETTKDKESELLSRLVEMQKENKRLRGELHQAESLARKAQEELKEIGEKRRREYNELVDLRNVVFQRENNEEDESVSKLTIEFPYTTKKSICVFGGHDSWRKVIKQMFTNVRFIHKDTIPNVGLIKNADVIWIQPNSIAHAYFYSIIDIVRTHNIPIRYFSFASAIKCAEQLVLDDLT